LSEKNGKGNPEVIEFEELELEDNEPTSSKEEQLATFLKDKLSEEDFGAVAKILGIAEAEDLSNAELLEKLTELLQKGKTEEEMPEEKPDEKEMQDYKTFMKDCMAEGKSMEECQAEYKKKYPEPKEKMKDGTEDLEENEELEGLKARIAELEGKLEMEEISNEVSNLVQAKHLSPRQAAPVVKLGAGMTEEMRNEFFSLFKAQKFTVSEDKGLALQKRPGEEETIDAETRARILKEQGIEDLISERGIKRRNN